MLYCLSMASISSKPKSYMLVDSYLLHLLKINVTCTANELLMASRASLCIAPPMMVMPD